MEIHQILPTISPGDAIGNEVIEIRDILRKWGYKSDIYAQNIHSKMNAKRYTDYKKVSSKDNILIFHFSIGSEVSDFVKTLPDRKILRYHNITPYEYYIGINDYLANLVKNGRNELRSFCDIIDLALGNSDYSRLELQEYGFRNTGVLPILVDFEKYNNPNHKLLERYEDDYINILFVGRIIPQKKQEDLIKTYYYYKCINSKSRLFLVGNYEGSEKYYKQLQELIRRLKLKDVYITGMTDFKDMVTYYKLADVFLCMSDWESFCVPLLESMFFDIPIVAYNSTAIPYTLGKAGILINEKNYEEIAEMINLLVEDTELRNRIIKKQNERWREFDKKKIEKKFKKYIEDVLLTTQNIRISDFCGEEKKNDPLSQNYCCYEKIWDYLAKTDVLNSILTGADLNAFDEVGEKHARMLSQFIDIDSIVLDVGCGIGRIEKFMGPLCGELHAADVSSEMLKKAKKRLRGQSNIFLQNLNGRDLRCYHDNKFDFVFSMLVLQHIEKEDAYVYLKEMYRVLKKGGKAFFQFPNLLSFFYFDKTFLEYVKHRDRSATRVRPYTLPEVRKIVESINFEIESITDDGTFLNTDEICVIAFKR